MFLAPFKSELNGLNKTPISSNVIPREKVTGVSFDEEYSFHFYTTYYAGAKRLRQIVLKPHILPLQGNEVPAESSFV